MKPVLQIWTARRRWKEISLQRTNRVVSETQVSRYISQGKHYFGL